MNYNSYIYINSYMIYMNCRSTITNLLVTEHIVANAINAHQALDIISFDFSRAFESAS